MKRLVIASLMLALIAACSLVVYAQAQKDVTSTTVIAAADVTLIKNMLLGNGDGPMSRGDSRYVDTVDGAKVVTDANVAKWIASHVQSAIGQARAQDDEQVWRKARQDDNMLTAEQKAAKAAFLAAMKKK